MTREEAIAYGKRVIDLGLNDETQAFCELAIKALEQEPCEDFKQKAGGVISQLRADRDRFATALDEIERTITEHAYPVRYDTNSIELGMTLTGIKQAFDMHREGKNETN